MAGRKVLNHKRKYFDGKFGSLRSVLNLCLALLLCPGFAQAEEPVAGTVVTVSGDVLIRSILGSGTSVKKITAGMKVHKGDTINTSSAGSVRLLMSDRTILDLGPSSLFAIDQYKKDAQHREVNLDLPYGAVRAGVSQKLEANSTFRIRTRSATMGVRGTDFRVKMDLPETLKSVAAAPPVSSGGVSATAPVVAPPAPKMEVVVLQGKVDLFAGGRSPASGGGAAPSAPPVQLSEGMAVTTTGALNASAPPTPKTLDNREMNQVRAENQAMAPSAFVAAVTVKLEAAPEPAKVAEKSPEKKEEKKADEKKSEEKKEEKKSEEKKEEKKAEEKKEEKKPDEKKADDTKPEKPEERKEEPKEDKKEAKKEEKTEVAKAEAKPEPKPETKAEPKAEPKTEAKAESRPEPKPAAAGPAPASVAAAAPPPVAAPPPPPPAVSAADFVTQVVASAVTVVTTQAAPPPPTPVGVVQGTTVQDTFSNATSPRNVTNPALRIVLIRKR